MNKNEKLDEAYHKFQVGDPLTDSEIVLILKHIRLALPMLSTDKSFWLARKELLLNLTTLEGYQESRKRTR